MFASSRDRFRTVVNVLGDAFGAGIVAHLSRDELREAAQAGMEEGERGEENHELIVPSEGRFTRKDPDQNQPVTTFMSTSEDPAKEVNS